MRTVYLLLILLPTPAFAAGNICDTLVKRPTVVLQMVKPQRLYRQNQTLEELTAIAKSSGVAVKDNGVVTGLTTDRKRIVVDAWYETAQLQSGFCLSPQARITIDQRVVTVSMPKEIPSKSCFFQVTLDHEHKHAKIAEEAMDVIMREESARIQAELAGQYGFQQTLGDAQYKIDKLKQHIEHRVQQGLARLDQMNSSIDTPEEYARVNSACKGRDEPKPQPWWKRVFGS